MTNAPRRSGSTSQASLVAPGALPGGLVLGGVLRSALLRALARLLGGLSRARARLLLGFPRASVERGEEHWTTADAVLRLVPSEDAPIAARLAPGSRVRTFSTERGLLPWVIARSAGGEVGFVRAELLAAGHPDRFATKAT